MSSEDLRQVLTISDDTSPEEAASNINRSRAIEVDPDTYKDLKSEVEPKLMSMERVPANIEPATEEFLTTSKQHLALAKNDIPKLSDTEKMLKYYGNKFFTQPNRLRDRNELIREKMFSSEGKLAPEKEEMLQDMNQSLSDMSQEDYGYKPGSVESFLGDVGGAAIDIGRSYWENKGLVGLSTVGGGVLGAVGGFIGTFGNPAGAVAGFQMGAGPGLAFAATAVPLVDSYMQTSASVFAELDNAVNETTQEPLNLSHGRKLSVAQGVGVISGVAAAYAGKVLANNNPFLRKFLDPKSASKYVINNPALMAKVDIIGGLLNSGKGEAVEEFVQQYAETIGTELGKVDGSEESFMNALDNISSLKTLKEAAYAGAVGMGAGTSFAGATNLPQYGNVKRGYERVQEVSRQKREVLETQNMMIEANAMLHDTQIQKLAPEEAKAFKTSLLEKLGFDDGAWFTVEDLQKFASEPKKGEKVRSIMDLNPELTKMAQETNSAVQMSKADVLDIMTEFPDISEFMRNHPDGQSPFEVRTEGKTFAENLTKADQARTDLMQKLGIVEDAEGLPNVALNEALGDLKDSPYFESEIDYLENSIVSERDGILTKEQAEIFNSEKLEAKLEVAKSLREDVDAEYARKTNKVFKETNDVVIRQEIAAMQDDLDLISKFGDKKWYGDLKPDNKVTERGKFSPFAIDPRHLPDDLREAYTGDKRLQERGAFAVGGLHPDEAAAYMGVESGEVLLKRLANIPNKKELATKKKQREMDLRNQIEQGFKEDRLNARDEAFSKNTTIHLREMDYMTKKQWPTLKRGIIKIAGKVPSIESLNEKAKTSISGMRIRNLNPNQFKSGEARSHKAALKNFLNSEHEQAFANKEKAAFNSELRKEALNAQDKIAKNQKFWKKMQDPSVVQTLKDAGKWKDMQNFMNLYKLEGRTAGEADQKAFNTFIKKQVEMGEPVPFIPESLNNTQASFKDLTVEQYQAITEMGQYMLHIAERKNKVLAAREKRLEFETQEKIAEEIDRLAKEHVDYDETRASREEKTSRDSDYIENLKNKFKSARSSVNNMKNIIMQMDNYKSDGFFYRTFVDPLVRAQTGKRQDTFDLRKYHSDVINEFYGGMKGYTDMVNERVYIPEFANIDTLNNGDLRKVDLLRMMAFMGDPDGRKRIENYKDSNGSALTFDKVMAVLEREVSTKEAGFVQNFFVNPYKRYEAASADLQKRTTGFDPEMVKGVPYTHKGKVYEGGYQPIKYQRLPDEVRAEQELETFTNEGLLNESAFFGRMKSAEMTKQDRMKERTGSQRPMQLSFEDHFSSLEEIIHDIHFREPGIDLMKIVKEPHNVKNIKSVVGSKNFVLMMDSVKDVVSKASDKDSVIFREQNAWLNNAIAYGKQLHAVKTISLNIGSAAIQWTSLATMPIRTGPKHALYLGHSIAKLVANPLKYFEMIDTAIAINPDIKFEMDSVDESLIKDSQEFIPHGNIFFKNYKKLGNNLTALNQIRQKAISSSFFMLREADRFNKVMATLSLSEQFLNGDHPDFSMEDINKMSDTEKKATLQRIVKQNVDLTQTASSRLDKTALEKSKVGQLFTNYWTDTRSQLNSMVSQGDKVRRSIKKGDYQQAATQAMWLAMVAGFAGAMKDVLRNEEENALKQIAKIKNPKDARNFALDTAFDFLKAPVVETANSIPGVNALTYAYESTVKYGRGNQVRPVSIPLLGVATDIVGGAVALRDVLSSANMMKKAGKKHNRKALLTTAGYMVGGAPTNMVNKLIDAAGNKKFQRNVKALFKDTNDTIDEYRLIYQDEPEAQEFIQSLNEYQKTLPHENHDVTPLMPENAKDNLMTALSDGDWKKVDNETGAAGIYQFTEERWRELMASHPDLALTENGRVAKDSKQQEKAMERELQENAKSFMIYEIDVTEENLLGAHKFGFDNFASIIDAKDEDKLKSVLGDASNSPVFKKFKTVGEVKSYLRREVKKAKELTNN
jgi:hypothetical protein